jgi:hypothetical protein
VSTQHSSHGSRVALPLCNHKPDLEGAIKCRNLS